MATKQADGAVSSTRARVREEDLPAPEPVNGGTAPAMPEETESTPLESSKRRMPDKFKRFLLRVQGGKFYLPAAYRIVWFRDECPDWGISTELVEGGHEAGFATVKACVYNPDGRLIASDYKTESKQDFPAGWVEKATTGAIARALALTGFGTQFAPELDDEGYRPADSPQPLAGADPQRGFRHSSARVPDAGTMPAETTPAALTGPATAVWQGPGQCPRCHAPEGKRHGRPCIE